MREGWPNEEIKIYSPGADHGTFDYFTEEINGKAQESRNDGQITFSADTNAIVQGVAGDKMRSATSDTLSSRKIKIS